jgi:hypothetical protein
MIENSFIADLPFSSNSPLPAVPTRFTSAVDWVYELQKFWALAVGYL